MDDLLHKFPSTPHLLWLGHDAVRDDKVMTPGEVRDLLDSPLIVEEKVDGANLGISIAPDGKIRFQNRGNWLSAPFTGQWTRLRAWAAERESALNSVLPPGHILFGEWCYAKHSIHYEFLPDWFMAFDIYDVTSQRFWSADRRNAFANAAHVCAVPEIARGKFSRDELLHLLDERSAFATSSREGIYLRRESHGWLTTRAKIVRPQFTQAITEHWTSKNIEVNKVSSPTFAQR